VEKINKTFEDYIMFLIAVRSLKWFHLDITAEIAVGKEIGRANFAGAQVIILKELQRQTQDHVIETYGLSE